MKTLPFTSVILAAVAMLCLALSAALLLRPLETSAFPFPPQSIAANSFPRISVASNPSPPARRLAIAARPLFSPSRRPFVPERKMAPAPVTALAPAAPKPEGPATADSLMLRGILLRGEMASALIASSSNPGGTWLTSGAQIEGWILQSIQPASVRLYQGKHRLALELYPKR